MTVRPKLNGIRTQLTLHRGALDRPTARILDPNLVRANLNDITILEIGDLARDLQER
jgi:hypothetical protein